MKHIGLIAGALILSAALAAAPSTAQDPPARPDPKRTIPERMEPPGGSQQPGRANLSPEEIKNAKEALRAKGLNPGPPDGTWDNRTRQALREFQEANQLPATGTLDAKTAEKLGIPLGGQKG
ncbi:MAG: hypothetical protein GEU77_00890 [Deltaproteobacteria bacterium]|nr:hypothetical protein [Deltaproteobacteria bacterium]